jgi:hypothetical protein
MSSRPVVVDRRPVDLRPDPLGQLLPGTMLEWCSISVEHDAVARADVGVAPGRGDEVDRLGRVADEDHLAPVGGADVVGDGRPRPSKAAVASAESVCEPRWTLEWWRRS